MSHHLSSLAFDELQEQVDSAIESNFEPNLQLLINERYALNGSSSLQADEEIVCVRGRVTISF